MEHDKKLCHTATDLNPFKIGNVKERREYYFEKCKTSACKNLLDDESNACSADHEDRIAKYFPSDYSTFDKYEKVNMIYELPLSPSVITLNTCKESGENVVKKTLLKDKLITECQIKAAQHECVIHSSMSHENIIKLYNYSENETSIALIMEYANKATMLQDLVLEQHTPIEDEQELQIYALDILNALDYVHKQGVVHCDIKLDNLLAHQEDDDNYPIIKLCDFGLSHVIDPNNGNKALKQSTVGTWGYIAPEVKDSIYIGRESDMWSFGLTLYEMAVAYKPTQVKDYKYGSGDIPFRKFDWRGKPEELKNLIQGCLEIDPTKRLTAEDAIQHPYFTAQV